MRQASGLDAQVLVVGAGIAGMATAARLQARGLSTLVLEAHGQIGGCAGFFRRRGFSFDVGATTLVDFADGGVGGRFLAEIGLTDLAGEALPGYRAWLPDRTVALHRDAGLWRRERLAAFGDSPAHRCFWRLLDRLAAAFWQASRAGLELPLRSPGALLAAARAMPLAAWPLARYLGRTVAWALADCGLAGDVALRAFLAMLLQDPVHAAPEDAPLINGALGVTIRGAGLTRAAGGMRGFFGRLAGRYRELGGRLLLGTRVERIAPLPGGGFAVETQRGTFRARQVVSTLPIWDAARLGPPAAAAALSPYLARDGGALGGASCLFLGVPEGEVAGQELTHHQVLLDYGLPLGDGNNMFVSVSAPGDLASAPAGCRAVVLSTHTELAPWEGLAGEEYGRRKAATAERLLAAARRVYPELGRAARVAEVATPRTYARFTSRHRGAVGGVRLNPANANFHAVPHDLGVAGYWQAGDTTWPGLGTVACILGSLHVAEAALRHDARAARGSRRPAAARPAYA